MSSEVMFWTKPMLQRRWQTTDRSIDRWWKETGRLPQPDTYIGPSPAWSDQTIRAAEAEWAREGLARRPHQDTAKALAAAMAEKRAQAAKAKAGTPRKPTRSAPRGRR